MNAQTDQRSIRVCEDRSHDRVRAGLLDFWRRHPNASFEAGAISCAFCCRGLPAGRALSELVHEGIVETEIRGGLTLYRLTSDNEKRRQVLELVDVRVRRETPRGRMGDVAS